MAPSKRTFYRTTIQVVVLSEEPFNYCDLDDVYQAITTGDCSGEVTTTKTEEVDGPTMASALLDQHSDPGFFGLTEDGDDEDEEDEDDDA
jgi:hypothetical protein